MRGRGEQSFHVLELLHTMYLCPVLRSTLIRKTALKPPVFLRWIFLLIGIREYLFDGQHAFLLLVKPVAVAWPSQRWMGKLAGGSAHHRLRFTRRLHLGSLTTTTHHHRAPAAPCALLTACRGKASRRPGVVTLSLQMMQHRRNERYKSGNKQINK